MYFVIAFVEAVVCVDSTLFSKAVSGSVLGYFFIKKKGVPAMTFNALSKSLSPCLFVTQGDRVTWGLKSFTYQEVRVMLAVFQDMRQHKCSLITRLLNFHQIQLLIIT